MAALGTFARVPSFRSLPVRLSLVMSAPATFLTSEPVSELFLTFAPLTAFLAMSEGLTEPFLISPESTVFLPGRAIARPGERGEQSDECHCHRGRRQALGREASHVLVPPWMDRAETSASIRRYSAPDAES